MRASQEAIDRIFEESQDQDEALSRIYRLVFPDWEKIKKIHGWPACSQDTWRYICRKFQELDRKFHPSVIPGGAWMNSGFSSSEQLKGWNIDVSPCTVEYEEAV